MTSLMLRDITNGFQNRLQTKDNFDNVSSENKKPPAETEGFGIKFSDLVVPKSDNGALDTPIISELPNLYKQNGSSVSKTPFSIPFLFIAIPEYFYTSGWLNFDNPEKFTKRMMFLHWAFKKCSTNPKRIPFDGRMVDLGPYEFIHGRNKSAEECGLTVEELRHQLKTHLEANFLEKAPSSTPSRFTVYRWVTANFYENNPQLNPPLNPQLNPQLNPHKSDERLKKRDIDNKNHPLSPSFEKKAKDDGIDDSFQKKKNKTQNNEGKILICRDVYLTKEELEDCIKFHGSREKVEWQINKILDSPSRTQNISRWAYAIKKWKFPNEVVDRRSENEQIAKNILKKYRDTSGWMVEHYRDTNKDAAGLLFQNSTGYGQTIFILYSDTDFERKVNDAIKSKNMKPTK